MFDQVVLEFLADIRLAGRAERTIEGHEQELKRLGRWLDQEGLDWQSLRKKELQSYTRLRAGKGHSSRANMLCSLRTFFRWAVEQEYCAMSPAASFKTPARPRPLPRSLSLDQLRRLLEHLNQAESRREMRDRAMILTALYAGLRCKELAGLRWLDIDMSGGVVSIEISKMNKGRAIPLHPDLRVELEAWHERQALDCQFVFSLDGQKFNATRVGKVCRALSDAVGFRFTAHQLRHTFATQMLRHSRDLYAVSKSLGHSQVAQTEVYLSADVEQLRLALTALPALNAW